MSKFLRIVFGIIFLLSISCKDVDKRTTGEAHSKKVAQELKEEKTSAIVQNTIKSHGGSFYDTANYEFVFRNKMYTFNNNDGYLYRVNFKDSLQNNIEDVLQNGSFSRKVNDKLVDLSEKDIAKYSNALNSVIYFATLPHKLNDKAVQKEDVGETVIKGEDYDVIRVTFGKEGGGTDHDDVFMYWINKKSHYINYLAYSYSTNNGGVRFRSAYNPRTIDGIRFQDYINWEAPIGTPLKELPALLEKEELKELSRIETEDVRNLNAEGIE
ncbi:hypothetical protein CLV90_0650 [Maribacter spongiicola]|uniref:Deoxyribose-phosphate aldolase n=1 Tax=Maribacter spongiicola TaxID=1206753 RepID=A0A4R7K5T3_9FLAO|nr:DUF6503 family protein [Maribacter spongiicola]TDT46595.1 hypothetical protein CLV90_0650 [Maribacter spongiicola]